MYLRMETKMDAGNLFNMKKLRLIILYFLNLKISPKEKGCSMADFMTELLNAG